MYPHLFVLAQRDGGTRQRKALHPYRLLPQTLPLAVPKNFGGMRLEIFDRGAVPRSLFRPLGALRGLRPLRGEKLLPKEGIFLISTAVVQVDSRFQCTKEARPFALCVLLPSAAFRCGIRLA